MLANIFSSRFASNLMLSAILLAPTGYFVSSAEAAPTSAELAFTYDVESGTLRATHTLNQTPASRCVFNVRADVHYEGRTSSSSRRSVLLVKATRKKIEKFRVHNLPGVRKSSTEQNPVLTLQARTVCGGTTIYSNATARYVQCGKGGTGVTAGRFLNLVARSIRR